jgi:hypothetical protein
MFNLLLFLKSTKYSTTINCLELGAKDVTFFGTIGFLTALRQVPGWYHNNRPLPISLRTCSLHPTLVSSRIIPSEMIFTIRTPSINQPITGIEKWVSATERDGPTTAEPRTGNCHLWSQVRVRVTSRLTVSQSVLLLSTFWDSWADFTSHVWPLRPLLSRVPISEERMGLSLVRGFEIGGGCCSFTVLQIYIHVL